MRMAGRRINRPSASTEDHFSLALRAVKVNLPLLLGQHSLPLHSPHSINYLSKHPYLQFPRLAQLDQIILSPIQIWTSQNSLSSANCSISSSKPDVNRIFLSRSAEINSIFNCPNQHTPDLLFCEY